MRKGERGQGRFDRGQPFGNKRPLRWRHFLILSTHCCRPGGARDSGHGAMICLPWEIFFPRGRRPQYPTLERMGRAEGQEPHSLIIVVCPYLLIYFVNWVKGLGRCSFELHTNSNIRSTRISSRNPLGPEILPLWFLKLVGICLIFRISTIG